MSFKAKITLAILKLSLIFSCVIFLSDEGTPSPRERKVLINVNSMTLSSEHMCREDIERLEHHSPLAIDCQYNESSGTEWKSFGMTNNKTLGNLQWDKTAEGPFNLNPGGGNER